MANAPVRRFVAMPRCYSVRACARMETMVEVWWWPGLMCKHGDVAQMVERSLSMREALGSMPSFSTL